MLFECRPILYAAADRICPLLVATRENIWKIPVDASADRPTHGTPTTILHVDGGIN